MTRRPLLLGPRCALRATLLVALISLGAAAFTLAASPAAIDPVSLVLDGPLVQAPAEG